MNNVVMVFNQDQANKASGSEALSSGGAYSVNITQAVYGASSAKGTKYIEFSGVCSNGEKVNYLKLYYQKADVNTPQGVIAGGIVSGGNNAIQAIMCICNIQQITATPGKDAAGGQVYFAPEFNNKLVGLFLQKRLYTKNDGSDGYSFEIKLPFYPDTNATVKERMNNSPIQTVQRIAESYADIDERGGRPAQAQTVQVQASGGLDQFVDDDIDF
jgi:hypothetical protein